MYFSWLVFYTSFLLFLFDPAYYSNNGLGFFLTKLEQKLMSLRKLQSEFTYHVSLLVLYAYSLGYELTDGHALRCEDCKVGRKYSNHKKRLARDYNLFKDGIYLDRTEDHRVLGEWWEKQHPRARWGGNFNDGNHYSFEYGGRV